VNGTRNRPSIIAHRGASGYLPEHSLAAKALAFGQGADFLEQDIVASRDGELLVVHDTFLDYVTDVADRFPGRQRADGHFYCIDFDLAEIKTLLLRERVTPEGHQQYPERYPGGPTAFGVCTFEEELSFIAGLIRSAGRSVGIYPEIKSPAWQREQGIDVTPRVLATLEKFGYLAAGQPIFLQCYDRDELKRVRAECPDLPLVQLISSRSRVDAALLDDTATYANGIGPSMQLILTGRAPGGAFEISGLVTEAQARGLSVHPYTFRADDLPDACNSFDELLELFFGRLKVDGVFTDFPDRVRRWLNERGQ